MLSILDHLLPGVRKVRIPLLTGSAIIIAVWIWWPGVDTSKELSLRASDDPIRRFVELWQALPSTLQGALALTVAYMVGSFWTQITYPIGEGIIVRNLRSNVIDDDRRRQPVEAVFVVPGAKSSSSPGIDEVETDSLATVFTEAQLAKERVWIAAFDELHLRIALALPLAGLGAAIGWWVGLILFVTCVIWVWLIIRNTTVAANYEEERSRRDPGALAARQRQRAEEKRGIAVEMQYPMSAKQASGSPDVPHERFDVKVESTVEAVDSMPSDDSHEVGTASGRFGPGEAPEFDSDAAEDGDADATPSTPPSQEIQGVSPTKAQLTEPSGYVEAEAQTAEVSVSAFDAIAVTDDGVAKPDPITPGRHKRADGDAGED